MIARRSLLGLLAGLPFIGRAVAAPSSSVEVKVIPVSELIFARKGSPVTCENGHIICEAAHDIKIGDMPTGTDWVNWRQPVPAVGTPAEEIHCRVCGARWFGKYGLAQSMHFSDGWR